MQALLHTEVVQLQRKVWHDKSIKENTFQEGYWALFYDSRFKDLKGKLMTRWLGPYIVENVLIMVPFKSEYEEGNPLLVNGHRLEIY